jgi:hypothetical protein
MCLWCEVTLDSQNERKLNAETVTIVYNKMGLCKFN